MTRKICKCLEKWKSNQYFAIISVVSHIPFGIVLIKPPMYVLATCVLQYTLYRIYAYKNMYVCNELRHPTETLKSTQLFVCNINENY